MAARAAPGAAALLLREVPSARTLLGGLFILGVVLYAAVRAHRDKLPGDAPA